MAYLNFRNIKKVKSIVNGLILLPVLLISACSSVHNKVQQVTLPELKNPIKITVQQVINPRFDKLNNQQIAASLSKAKQHLFKELGVNVEFELKPSQTIDVFFKHITTKIIASKKQQNINFKDGINKKEFDRIARSIKSVLMSRTVSLDDLYQYSKPYLINNIQALSYDSLSNGLTKVLANNVMAWKDIKAKDGNAVIDDMPYNEWIWWDAMGYGDLGADLIITNQLVASVENYDMDVHAALRGGVNNGTTTYSQTSQYQSYSFVSSYPIINNTPQLQILRGEKNVSNDDKSTYLALIITHELGHLLFHYGHPYGKTECIMSPMPLINYKNWLLNLDAEKCKNGDYPSMQKGNVKLMYETDLRY